MTDVTVDTTPADSPQDDGPIKLLSQGADIRKRFLKNRLAVLGAVMVSLVILTSIFAPLIAPYDAYLQDLENTQANPGGAHLLGTDELGRDILSRIIYGSRVAVTIGFVTIIAAMCIGLIVGAAAGFLGGLWDTVLMRVADVFLAFPVLIGAILIITVVSSNRGFAFMTGLPSIILALAIFGWPTASRLLRSSVLAVRHADFVDAARSMGASRWRILTRHVLPNSLTAFLIYAAVSVPAMIVAEAALTYLGVGLPPGTADWGAMISDGQKFFGFKDYLWFFPSIALVFTTLGFVLVSDGLRDALDPKLR